MAASLFFAAAGRGAEPSIAATTITLGTSSGEIAAEVFQQPDEKKRPAILVLHGAGGTLLDGPEMRRVARELAGAGNAVYLVHYFESTGTLFARDASMEKNFGTWLQTVLDSIGAIQEARRDSSPVGNLRLFAWRFSGPAGGFEQRRGRGRGRARRRNLEWRCGAHRQNAAGADGPWRARCAGAVCEIRKATGADLALARADTGDALRSGGRARIRARPDEGRTRCSS